MGQKKGEVRAPATSAVRRPGRPKAAVLTRERITTAALRLITRRGPRAFTLDALARDLGVSTSALYNHAASKSTVLLWVQDAINATIDIECFDDQPCWEAMEVWARSYRAAYAGMATLIPVMAVQPIADAPRTIAMYDAVTSALVADGWRHGDALNVIVAVEAYLFGAALDLDAPDEIYAPGAFAEQAPSLSAAVEARRLDHGSGRRAADAAFDLGLRALLTGLQTARH